MAAVSGNSRTSATFGAGRRHSVDVASTSSIPSGSQLRHITTNHRGPLTRRVPIEVDVVEEGQAQGHSSQGVGLLHRPQRALGLTPRWPPSSSSSVKSSATAGAMRPQHPVHSLPRPGSPPPPTATTTNAASGTCIGRRRSDGNLSLVGPTSGCGTSLTTASADVRPSSPRPPAANRRLADELRSASYEEELELRLEHVRLRAVEAERRLAAERLRRRQAVQKAADVEQQHIEAVRRLTAEAERKTERMTARFDQVREDCRRRMADTERRGAANAERLETRIRQLETELAAALRRLVDDARSGGRLRLAHSGPGRCDADAQTEPLLPSTIPFQIAPVKTCDAAVVSVTTGGCNEDPIDKLSLKPPPTDSVWCSLYEMVTALALSRVRYLEELVSDAGSDGQCEKQLRQLKAARRRAVAAGAERKGKNDAAVKLVDRASSKMAISSVDADDIDDSFDDGLSAMDQLRRTSSCPTAEMLGTVKSADEGTSDDASKDDLRSAPDDVIRSQSADELSDLTSGGLSRSRKQHYKRAVSESATTMETGSHYSSAVNVSDLREDSTAAQLASARLGQSADDVLDSNDDGCRATSTAAKAAVRPTVMLVTTVTTASALTTSTTPTTTSKKRHTSLHLDFFRKLQQTGAAIGRRRERPASTIAACSATADDDRGNASSTAKRNSLSPRTPSYSSGVNFGSSPTSPFVRSVGSGPMRAVPSPGATSMSSVDSAIASSPSDAASSLETNSLLRRSLPLSPRRSNRAVHRDSSCGPISFVARTSIDDAPLSSSPPTHHAGRCVSPVAEVGSVDSESDAPQSPTSPGFNQSVISESVVSSGSSSNRIKSSSFGRLQERRNGLTTTTAAGLALSGGQASKTLLPQCRPPSSSRLDSLAKNIKSYLTNQ